MPSTISSNNNLSTALVSAVVASLGTAAVMYYWHYDRTLRRLTAKHETMRQAERTGRIRAQVKLRTLLKQQQQSTNPTADSNNNRHDMKLQCIGTITSPYTKRMGTPRQGALVPSSRGMLTIAPSIPMEALDGLEGYSHVWIVFGFHANTDYSAGNKKSKVQPPRAPHKVGQLATRSPHRPNPLGLSLVRLLYIDAKQRQVHLRALDLVHGTPVYDIKPCVPWDVPRAGGDDVSTSGMTSALRVPDWVAQKEDELSCVEFTPQATQNLQEAVASGRLAPLYTMENDGFEGARETLQQVLTQDPRASYKRGTNTTTKEEPYKIMFGQVQVDFVVLQNNTHSAFVQVVQVQPMDFSETAYVDGVPLTHI